MVVSLVDYHYDKLELGMKFEFIIQSYQDCGLPFKPNQAYIFRQDSNLHLPQRTYATVIKKDSNLQLPSGGYLILLDDKKYS